MPDPPARSTSSTVKTMVEDGNDLEDRGRAADRDFILEAELALRWRRSVRTLQRWRQLGIAPDHHVIGGRVLYRRSAVERAEEASLRSGRTEG